MTRRPRGLVLLLALPATAWGHSLTDEVGLGASPPTPASPSAGYVYDRLGGEFDINEHWDIRADAMVTRDEASAPQQGTRFGNSGGTILFFDLGGDWQPTEHVSIGAEVNGSPKSNQFSDAQISVAGPDGGTLPADSDLRTATSSVGFVVNVGLDTAGDSNWESAGNASFGATHFSTDQSVAAVATRRGNVDLQVLRNACTAAQATAAKAPVSCASLLGAPGDITQSRVSVNVTETVYLDTDLGLTGAYYIYDKDPTQIGYFTLATRGRLATAGSFSFGQGLAIAPYQFTVRPDIAHRFGGLRVDLSYQYGQYVPGQGYSNALGVKVDYKFNRAWKVWVTVVGEKDVDGSGNETNSGSLALGVRYRF